MQTSPRKHAVYCFLIALSLAVIFAALAPILGDLSLILTATTPLVAVTILSLAWRVTIPNRANSARLVFRPLG